MARLAAVTLFLIFGVALPALAAETIAGQATVIDGDTLEIHGDRIRLDGIDAPETRQLCRDSAGKDYRCGQQAALALADWIGRRTVECEPTGRSWGRVVARCRVDGAEIGAWLATEGWGLVDPRYSDRFAAAQDQAEAAKTGIWQGEFNEPWAWRKGERLGD